MIDLTGSIMAYEDGTIGAREALDLFSHLIRTGMAWTLQGSYGRSAAALIENGMITRAGVITAKAINLLSQRRAEGDG